MKRLAQSGRARVAELGVSIDADSLWFNLGPAADRRADAERPWLDVNVRRAISLAVDRKQFVNTVMLGAGTPLAGPITPGNGLVRRNAAAGLLRRRARRARCSPPRASSIATATACSRRAPASRCASSSSPSAATPCASARRACSRQICAPSASTSRLRRSTPATLGERITKGNYDATYFGFSTSDTDPSTNLDYWLSSGSFHVWHPLQTRRRPPNGRRQIDALMREVTSLSDPAARKARFDRVQRIFVDQLPAIYFAAPIVTIAMSPRVTGAEPGAIFPYVLWRADTLAAAPAR